MNWTRALLAALLVLLFAPAAAPAAPSGGNFLLGCDVHTVSRDDPIVFPGQPGAAHMHAFAGGQPVDAFSFFGSLVLGDTSCQFPGNKSAVWTPLIVSAAGEYIEPTNHSIYYRGTDREASTLFPFPMGLEHVHHRVTGYRCLNSNLTRHFIPPSCGGAGIEMSTYFPQCWTGDGVKDNPLGSCDDAHPINVPQIQVLTYWPPEAAGGHVDPEADHMHVDYMFAWNPYAMDDVIRKCLNTGISCRVRETGEVYDFGSPLPKTVVIPAGTYE